MFLPPIYSLLVIVALVAMYAIIRIKHGGPLLAPYSHIEGWWEWLKAIAYDFRSWVASALAGLLIAFPDLAVEILPIDLTWLVGEAYAKIVAGALTVYLALNRAWSTTPKGA